MKRNRIDKTNLKKRIKIGGKMLFWPLAIAIGIMGIFTMIEMTTTGAEIAKYQNDEAKLLDENKQLSDQIIKLTSLNSVESTAPQLGFVAPQKTVYISNVPEVAAKLP